MTNKLPIVALAALLSACSAAAPVTAPSTAPAAEDDQSRAIHGSTAGIPTWQLPTTTCAAPNTQGSGVVAAIACDSLAIDRMGLRNTLANDGNAATNPNQGQDYHLVVTANNFAPGVTMSKVTVSSAMPGYTWDSFGLPNYQYMSVFAADNATLLIKPGVSGVAVPLGGNPTFHLYADSQDANSKPALRAGDVITITLTTSVGDSVWPNLKL